MKAVKEKLKFNQCLLEENKVCDNCCECFNPDLDPVAACDGWASFDPVDYSGVFVEDILLLQEDEEQTADRYKNTVAGRIKTKLANWLLKARNLFVSAGQENP